MDIYPFFLFIDPFCKLSKMYKFLQHVFVFKLSCADFSKNTFQSLCYTIYFIFLKIHDISLMPIQFGCQSQWYFQQSQHFLNQYVFSFTHMYSSNYQSSSIIIRRQLLKVLKQFQLTLLLLKSECSLIQVYASKLQFPIFASITIFCASFLT